MTTGAAPLPMNQQFENKLMAGEYKFYYQGWKHPHPTHSNTSFQAMTDDMFHVSKL